MSEEKMPICTTDVCCIHQSIARECLCTEKVPCKWAVLDGTIPEANALCDGCDGDCVGAYEALRQTA